MSRVALVVGIDNYQQAQLQGAVNDAKMVAELLRHNEDGSDNFTTMQLTAPTDYIDRPTLRQKIKTLFSCDADIALFYFSGHGVMKSSGGYIATSDYQPDDEGIPMKELAEIANKSAIKNKIIILDCCHSGSVGNNNSDGDKCSQIANGITILTASRPQEGAIEYDGQGVFTSLLIDALDGEAADLRGNITPGDLYSYIDRGMGAFGQRPLFKTNISRFISIRQVKPSISKLDLEEALNFFPNPDHEYRLDETYEYTHENANPENTNKLKSLQRLVQVGLVKPIDEEYMYFAAINRKSCRLTALGKQYWKFQSNNNTGV